MNNLHPPTGTPAIDLVCLEFNTTSLLPNEIWYTVCGRTSLYHAPDQHIPDANPDNRDRPRRRRNDLLSSLIPAQDGPSFALLFLRLSRFDSMCFHMSQTR